MTDALVQLLIQSGGLGIAFFLIYTQEKERKRISKIVENHLRHSTKVIEKNTKTQMRLTHAIDNLAVLIKNHNEEGR